MDQGVLLHIDDYIATGKEKLVKSITSNAEKIGRFRVNLENPLYVVDNNDNDTINKVIQMCRDLNYCHIWKHEPIERQWSFTLDDGNKFIYLKLEAEAG
jgi:hypothetical protein